MQDWMLHMDAEEGKEKLMKSEIGCLSINFKMNSLLKFFTWNLCLGLANKKDLVTDTLKRKDISVCCLQEIEREGSIQGEGGLYKNL